ncbi:hypothetical protein GCM10009107_60640 [Ideonella azotifigens]|uniref:LysR substrate-binding domain-containing protein n=1 Tax=Ideonella azotifigens TaxID=513160 RepID=A0ABP3VYA2_9BURK
MPAPRLLPQSIAAEDLASGRLVHWGTVPGKPVEVRALHTSRRLVSAKVTAFVQCLCESFSGGVLA